MTVVVPGSHGKKDDDQEAGLAAAKRRLESASARPFELDEVLARERAREERDVASRHAAERKLEATVHDARERRVATEKARAEALKLAHERAEASRVLEAQEAHIKQVEKSLEERARSAQKEEIQTVPPPRAKTEDQ